MSRVPTLSEFVTLRDMDAGPYRKTGYPEDRRPKSRERLVRAGLAEPRTAGGAARYFVTVAGRAFLGARLAP